MSNADISLSRLDIPSHINDCLIPGEVHGISSPSGYKDFPVVSSSCPEAVKIFLASASSGIRAICPSTERHHDWTTAERRGRLVE